MNMYIGDAPTRQVCSKPLSNRSMWRCARDAGHEGPCALHNDWLGAAMDVFDSIPAPKPHDLPTPEAPILRSPVNPLKKRYRVTVSVEEVLVKPSGKEALVPITKAAAGVDLSTFDMMLLSVGADEDGEARAHYLGQALAAAAVKCTHHVQKQVFVYHRDID